MKNEKGRVYSSYQMLDSYEWGMLDGLSESEPAQYTEYPDEKVQYKAYFKGFREGRKQRLINLLTK